VALLRERRREPRQPFPPQFRRPGGGRDCKIRRGLPVDLPAHRGRNNKTYDLACTEEHGRGEGRLHHLTYATDQREDILRAADIFLENGVHIETGPHKHAIQGTFFLYVWEPAGNRVELANAGARLILAPDHEPVVWTETERKKGQAWGLKTIETFHTHGTPPALET
jgi:catechol 2,3-dioxygenase